MSYRGLKAGRATIELAWEDSKAAQGLRRWQRSLRMFGSQVASAGSLGVYGGGFGSLINLFVGAAAAEALLYPIKLAANLQRVVAEFTALSGSAEAAKKIIRELERFSRISIVPVTELEKAAQTLLGYGVANKTVVPAVKALTAISRGSAVRLDRLALAYGQVSVKQRLYATEVRQFVEAGFNPLQAIAERTGETMAEMSRRMESGAISADEVTGALLRAIQAGGRFRSILQMISTSLTGQFSKFIASFRLAIRPLGETVVPTLTGLLMKINKYMPAVAKAIKANAGMYATTIAVAAGLTALGATLLATGLAIQIGAFAVGGLAMAIGTLSSVIAFALSPVALLLGFIGLMGSELAGFTNHLMPVISLVHQLGQAASSAVSSQAAGSSDLLSTLFGSLMSAPTAIGGGVSSLMGSLRTVAMQAMRGLGDAIYQSASYLWKKLQEVGAIAGKALWIALSIVMYAYAPKVRFSLFEKIFKAIRFQYRTLTTILRRRSKKLADAAKDSGGSFVRSFLESYKNMKKEVSKQIDSVIVALVMGSKLLLKKARERLAAEFKGLGEFLRKVLQRRPSKPVNPLYGLIGTTAEQIRELSSMIGQFVGDLYVDFVNAASFITGSVGDAFAVVGRTIASVFALAYSAASSAMQVVRDLGSVAVGAFGSTLEFLGRAFTSIGGWLKGLGVAASLALGEALRGIARDFTTLYEHASRILSAIGKALAAGEIEAAAEVLFAALALVWRQGTDSLQTTWGDFKSAYMEATLTMLRDLKLAWIDYYASLEGFVARMQRSVYHHTDSFLTEVFARFAQLRIDVGMAERGDLTPDEIRRAAAIAAGARARKGARGDAANNAIAQAARDEANATFDTAMETVGQSVKSDAKKQADALAAARDRLAAATAVTDGMTPLKADFGDFGGDVGSRLKELRLASASPGGGGGGSAVGVLDARNAAQMFGFGKVGDKLVEIGEEQVDRLDDIAKGVKRMMFRVPGDESPTDGIAFE